MFDDEVFFKKLYEGNSPLAKKIRRHGENGFVFSQPEELVAILNSLADEELRASVGNKARTTAERSTWEKVADRYEEIYFRIAQEKNICARL